MFDPRDADQNYAAYDNVARGARFNEHVFRQLVNWGIDQIRSNVDHPKSTVIDELFSMLSAEERTEVKNWLRKTTNIAYPVNWPDPDVQLPFICFVNGSELEDNEFTVLGDRFGMSRSEQGESDGSREQRGIGLKNETVITVATQNSDLTLYLYWLTRFILFSNKDDLTAYYDVRDLVINGQDLRWTEELFPEYCFLKTITCSYGSVFDYSLPPVAKRLISLELGVATNFTVNSPTVVSDRGDADIVPVPSP